MNAATGKNEVTVEFHPNDDAPVSLIECRFHVPPNADPEAETDSVTVSIFIFCAFLKNLGCCFMSCCLPVVSML